jgi:pimeloyl-ACP methyl ester carboxylesterase
MTENELLRPGKKGALYALGNSPADFHADREPLVLVHGIQGDPKVLQSVVDRFRDSSRYQLYVLCYDDNGRRTSLNGNDLAEEMRSLERRLGRGRDVAIVAHSMGGIVARQALNQLSAGTGRGIERFGDVRLIAADTPWHGYPGPSDRGAEGVFMDIARAFMNDGLEDMRAASAMFAGDPDGPDPAARAGLLGVELADNVSTNLVFAAEGNNVSDYSESFLRPLAKSLLYLTSTGTTSPSGASRAS